MLFNRYLEADIDLDTLQFKPDLVLSNRHEASVPIRWIAILRDQIKASLAATGGVHRVQGVIKLLLAGADVTLMTSILLMKGPDFLRTLQVELAEWLEEHEYSSVEQLKGSMSRKNCPDASALGKSELHAGGYQLFHQAPASLFGRHASVVRWPTPHRGLSDSTCSPGYSNSITTWPPWTGSPAFTRTLEIFPSIGEVMTVSIFMASKIISTSLAFIC